MSKYFVFITKMLAVIAAINMAIAPIAVYSAGEETAVMPRIGRISNIIGAVEIKKADEEIWIKPSIGLELSQRDIIRTQDASSIDVEFLKRDGKYFKIRVTGNSRLSFTKLEYDNTTTIEDILLDLAIGEVFVKADKLNRKSKFRVRTPTSMIGIRGTRFKVSYGKAEGV